MAQIEKTNVPLEEIVRASIPLTREQLEEKLKTLQELNHSIYQAIQKRNLFIKYLHQDCGISYRTIKVALGYSYSGTIAHVSRMAYTTELEDLVVCKLPSLIRYNRYNRQNREKERNSLIRDLRDSGKSIREIADQFSLSVGAVRLVCLGDSQEPVDD